jgi:hypothetical protein
MPDVNVPALLRQLLAVTLECRDTLAGAALTIGSPGFAALLAGHAEDQARIARYLSAEIAPRVSRRAAASSSGSQAASGGSPVPGGTEPHALLGACLRALDASIVAFRQAHLPALTFVQRITLRRYEDQMGWAREHLFRLREAYAPASRGTLGARVRLQGSHAPTVFALRAVRVTSASPSTRALQHGEGEHRLKSRG